ncbi:MAG: TRAM domain-containing protein [Nitrososphaerales archaeon]
MSRRGDGIAKIEGFIIFVPRAKAGQQVKIKITQVGNRYANGQIVEPVEKEGESQE